MTGKTYNVFINENEDEIKNIKFTDAPDFGDDYVYFSKEQEKNILQKFYERADSLVHPELFLIETQEQEEEYGYPVGTWMARIININYEQ